MRPMLAPLTARATWRRWGYLILGGALLMPYMMAGQVVVSVAQQRGGAGDPVGSIQLGIFLAVLPVVALTGLVLPVRSLEGAAVGQLLTGAVERPEGPVRSWRHRWRTAAWFTIHLEVGGLVSGVTLAMVPFAVWLCSLPLFGDPARPLGRPVVGEPGWAAAWGPPAGVAVLVGLIYLAAFGGAVLARLAPRFLGPTAADLLAEMEQRAARLAQRNRLARDLHDSVGHALSVVTVQAGAATRLLDSDPRFVRGALGAIEDSARSALEDLDHVLGLLREEEGSTRTPQRTLADLDALLETTRQAGVEVVATVDGGLDAVPAAVSRETYRIVQEGLTNSLRHAGKVPVTLRLGVGKGRLELEMTNPLGRPTVNGHGGGRGLAGIRERVALLHGEMAAAPADGQWQMTVRVPL